MRIDVDGVGLKAARRADDRVETYVAGPWRYARSDGAGHRTQPDRPDAVNQLLLAFFTRGQARG